MSDEVVPTFLNNILYKSEEEIKQLRFRFRVWRDQILLVSTNYRFHVVHEGV